MEPVGIAASLLTLIEAAGYTWKTAKKLRQRFQEAPRALEVVESDLCLIHIGLKTIERLHSNKAHRIISADARNAIQSELESANMNLRSLEAACDRLGRYESRRSRLKWAILDHSAMQKQVQDLRDTQSRLKSLFQILSLHEQSNLVAEVASVKEIVEAISGNLETKQRGSFETLPEIKAYAQRIVARGRQKSLLNLAKLISAHAWLRRIGIHFSLLELTAQTSHHSLKRYSLSFHFPLLPGYYACRGELTLQKHAWSPSLSIAEPSSFSFGRVVADDSTAVTACSRGDLFTLKQQLRLGKATLGDVTRSNRSLMTFAVMSGSVKLVQFLLDNGISANATFGSRQTSPLQWALDKRQIEIAALLVSHGANVNHVSMLGWTPLFYCWPQATSGQTVMLGAIDILSKADAIEVDLVDKWGWTVLQRLAAYGTAPEVRKVVGLGPDLMARHLPLGWPAIFHAVHYGNLPTFLELVEHYPRSILAETDERGWTMLHISALEGHGDITRRLLELGSNPWAISEPFFSHMPPSIYGRRCTPADVAASESNELLEKYEEIVAELGLSPRDAFADEEEEEDEKFWDAVEKFPL